jgi:hypothetical protein
MRYLVLLALAAAAMTPVPALGHSGGLDAQGCHNNRRTGDYHCHRGGQLRDRGSLRSRAERLIRRISQTYVNCSAARAAGAAPVRRGDPGYGVHLDRDRDGVGCE